MPELFAYEIVEAFGLSGCPLCRVLAVDERRWVDSFRREGKSSPEARRTFYAAGGFCRRHGWLLQQLAAEDGGGAAIVRLYDPLVERDLAWLDRVADELEQSRRRRRVALERTRPCPACVAADESLERKAHFLAEALLTAALREKYSASDGLCFVHLARAVGKAQQLDARNRPLPRP